VRRVYIEKVGKPGELRPLGVPTLEDKIVQRATVEVLNAIYEQDFRVFLTVSDRGVVHIKLWTR
jgi:RNA-directed DNA polymerase